MPLAARHSKQAFSLVELSIVLVILGLLVGGVLSGQSLIRAAELRAIPTELAQFQSAIYSFKDKYLALPGDITNATAFWGTHPTPLACFNPSPDRRTCNGNGNGEIDGNAEMFYLWQHLSNAGLIPGTYLGGYSSTPSSSPTSKADRSAYWQPFADGPVLPNVDPEVFAFPRGNIFLLSGTAFPGGTALQFLTPEDLWGIDKKIDDGLPYSGKVIAWKPSCTNADIVGDDSQAVYMLTVKDKVCHVYFIDAFR